MDILTERLASLTPSRVLEIATGSGGFARRLASCLGSYGDILATDSASRAVEAAARNLADLRDVRAELADANALPFPDAAFDLVAIANSLHHFEDPSRVIAEALRVLTPGGALVVFEMHRNAETEPERNHVRLHRFWARVDTAGGVYHAETFDEARFHSLLGLLEFSEGSWDPVPSEGGDPKDPGLLAEIAGTFAAYRQKIASIPSPDLRARLEAEAREAEVLVREHGFRSAPSILFVGHTTGGDGGRSCS
jgi:SAM-dependent methyltransferase